MGINQKNVAGHFALCHSRYSLCWLLGQQFHLVGSQSLPSF